LANRTLKQRRHRDFAYFAAPAAPFFQPVSATRRNVKRHDTRIDLARICHGPGNVEIDMGQQDMGQQIGSVQDQDLGGADDERIFQRLVFSHREDHCFGGFAEVERSGADEFPAFSIMITEPNAGFGSASPRATMSASR
jgi:hypothetical protein